MAPLLKLKELFKTITSESIKQFFQESELVRDLLCILSGGRATYIWMKKESTEEHRILPPEYELDPSINISLRSLTVEPLKVAAALHVLLNFSERYILHNFGMVAHAFVAELSNYVQEIRNNIVKLESVHVSLMKECAR